MQISHATLEHLRRGRDGREVLIEADVLDAVKRLRELDPALRVSWNEYGEYYVVKEILPDGSESLVTTTTDLSAHLADYVASLAKRDVSLADSVECSEAAKRKAKDYVLEQELSEKGERMAHAIRGGLEHKGKAFIPDGSA